jgi:hypothetical protein
VEEIGTLTEAYVRVRYSPEIPTADEVEDAQRTLAQIKQVLPEQEAG